ncbi:hypothetical protein PspLS_09189 [Pyricularia sp. CBS 133598]|nr:hypothetical protein PspLS_09189 [Pyricularia sp. CBS 133598]
MRIAIREQLALLVVLATLVALAIVSIPVWIYVHQFIIGVQENALSLTASLKAARIAAEIDLLQTTCSTIASRVLVQRALLNFYNGSSSPSLWNEARIDVENALNLPGQPDLLQARIYSRNSTGSSSTGLMATTSTMFHDIKLPYNKPDGTPAMLGNDTYGFPPMLYPNITYTDTGEPSPISPDTNIFFADAFPGIRLTQGLFLGPLVINDTYALVSLTVAVRDNTDKLVLGYMTLVASASNLILIRNSPEGLGNSGLTLLFGPNETYNRFNYTDPPVNNSTYKIPDTFRFARTKIHFVLPPTKPNGTADRHLKHSFESGNYNQEFELGDFPAVFQSLTSFNRRAVNNAMANLWTTNEQGVEVSVGTARPKSQYVDWVVVVEQDRAEALQAINTLRTILLGCVFGAAGLMFLLIFPCAHFSVRPIRDLKIATEKSIMPPGYDDYHGGTSENPGSGVLSSLSEKGWLGALVRRTRHKLGVPARRQRRESDQDESLTQRQVFKIPGKVQDRKHYITDELTELTTTFNEMTDELYKQYSSLDDKVAERTRELEISKKAAEAANESKTLFIANISHELKTPLNGIMGMCAVCMEETDVTRIKQSLKTLYKSGDLLLHLLEDLLSFSKNQIGHQISLEERDFRLGDIRQQLLSIFDKQVRESGTHFTVEFVGHDILDFYQYSVSPERQSMEKTRLPALGPSAAGAGRLKDMCLWGDQHRILQVIINLVSNSLKFTPSGGKVQLRIRCVEEIEQINPTGDNSRSSSFSKSGSARQGRPRHRVGSSSAQSAASTKGVSTPGTTGTALAINPMDPKTVPHIQVRERSLSPPPPGAKAFLFEFEVEDSGPGIPEHMQARVFEPFVQGDLGLSKKYGGTGLGLSICQQLATLMGGNITLRSTVGVGSVFTMRIPLKYVKDRPSSTASSSIKSRPQSLVSTDGDATNVRVVSHSKSTPDGKHASVLDNKPRLVGLSHPFFSPTQATAPKLSTEDHKANLNEKIAKAVAAKGGNKLRVLVADDNSTNVEVVSKMLRLEHVSDVTVASDGQEALEVVKANMENNLYFDLIFMDVQMPNLDGLQSTRLIRQMGYSAPIVALTAFSEESNVKECMESGMNEFLAKPIRRPALKQVLQKFATIPEEPEDGRRTTPPTSAKNVVTDTHGTKSPVRTEVAEAKREDLPNGHGNAVVGPDVNKNNVLISQPPLPPMNGAAVAT